MRVSLFVDPEPAAIRWAKTMGADRVELYTEPFARAFERGPAAAAASFETVRRRPRNLAHELGVGVNAGHDLDLTNLTLFRTLPHLDEVSIGHALISRAIFVGLGTRRAGIPRGAVDGVACSRCDLLRARGRSWHGVAPARAVLVAPRRSRGRPSAASLDGMPLAGEFYEASARPAPGGGARAHAVAHKDDWDGLRRSHRRTRASRRWRSICAGTAARPDRRRRCRRWCRTCAPRCSGCRRGQDVRARRDRRSSARRSAPAWRCWRRWSCRRCARWPAVAVARLSRPAHRHRR